MIRNSYAIREVYSSTQLSPHLTLNMSTTRNICRRGGGVAQRAAYLARVDNHLGVRVFFIYLSLSLSLHSSTLKTNMQSAQITQIAICYMLVYSNGGPLFVQPLCLTIACVAICVINLSHWLTWHMVAFEIRLLFVFLLSIGRHMCSFINTYTIYIYYRLFQQTCASSVLLQFVHIVHCHW